MAQRRSLHSFCPIVKEVLWCTNRGGGVFSDIVGLTAQATTAATYLQFGPMEPTLAEDHHQLPWMSHTIPLFCKEQTVLKKQILGQIL